MHLRPTPFRAARGEHVFVTRTFFRGRVRVRNSKNASPETEPRSRRISHAGYDIIIYFIHIYISIILCYARTAEGGGGGAFR